MTTRDSEFLREPLTKVTAAIIGISAERWEFVSAAEATNEDAARIRMRAKRFDVLPIVGDVGPIGYFETDSWNKYDSISRKAILEQDLISYDTDIREVVRRFAIEHRNFFFLSDKETIIGFLSIVNLNCRQAKLYFFNLMMELELALAGLVGEHLADDELRSMACSNDGEFAKSLRRYEADRRRGVDVPLVEYLTFSSLLNVAGRRRLFCKWGYSRTAFERLGSLTEIRDPVAHPARSLVRDGDSCADLWKRLQRLEQALVKARKA